VLERQGKLQNSQATEGFTVKDLDTVIAAVGPRVRELRRRRGMTLTTLSERTNITVSTLSRLESGQRRPGLELLLPVAEALRVPLDELVRAPSTSDSRVFPRPRSRNGMVVIPLARRPGGLQAFKHILTPDSDEPKPAPRSHPGHHWIYVLAGRMRIVLGSEELVLGPGEVVEFDTRVPHWFGRAGVGLVEFLSIVGPQGERFRPVDPSM
jgi:transcriptional regulator with XRE-family HTH domain